MEAKTLQLIQERVDALPDGAEVDVKTILGDQWASIQHKQSFGRQFKAALMAGKVTGLKHSHLHNSPRRDVYRKV